MLKQNKCSGYENPNFALGHPSLPSFIQILHLPIFLMCVGLKFMNILVKGCGTVTKLSYVKYLDVGKKFHEKRDYEIFLFSH